MIRLRRILFVIVFAAIIQTPVADADCVGTTCGAICENYSCTIIEDTNDSTMACKPVASSGCMSMNSLICCPRIPRE